MTDPTVKSAVRVLEILELFGEQRRPLTLKSIVASLNYPQSSTTVLLKTLVKTGFVHYDNVSRTYFPTGRVTALGDWIRQLVPPHSRLFNLMKEVQNATEEAVVVGIRNDIYVQFIRVLDSAHEIRFHVPEGTIRFLTQSSTGWMLLSSLDDEAIFKVLKRINAKVQDRSQKVQIEPFMKEMAKVRRDGYCYVPHLPIRNAGAVSMLVNTKSPPYQFVICAGGLVDRLEQNMRTIIKKMRTAIDRFSD